MAITPDKPVFPGQDQGASLTVREFFAALALQGLLAGAATAAGAPRIPPEDAAKRAREYADALVQEL